MPTINAFLKRKRNLTKAKAASTVVMIVPNVDNPDTSTVLRK